MLLLEEVHAANGLANKVIENIGGRGHDTGCPSISKEALDAHVRSVRKKLGEARDLVETVRSMGYRFAEPSA